MSENITIHEITRRYEATYVQPGEMADLIAAVASRVYSPGTRWMVEEGYLVIEEPLDVTRVAIR